MNIENITFTPKQVVSQLSKYIIGQHNAKNAVAIALRNRWRRIKLDKDFREEVVPKNIILIGSTGCGKTEIARRLAKLANAPFIKVEATKFTEVGYVGRDVDSMVRDLVKVAIKIAQDQAMLAVQEEALILAEEKVLDLLLPTLTDDSDNTLFDFSLETDIITNSNFNENTDHDSQDKLKEMLKNGVFDEKEINVEVRSGPSSLNMLDEPGLENLAINIQDVLSNALEPSKRTERKLKVKEAIELIKEEEAQNLIDIDKIQKDALIRSEQSGIIFIDEIDKIAGRGTSNNVDPSREGVQRDILPIVEGSTVNTKYGLINTEHILFIAAGAFHVSKPSDLIPELQGRFPICVELDKLTEEDFVNILKVPENSLVKQYSALLDTEDVELTFSSDGLEEIAAIATSINIKQENIGARRLYTVMEKLLENENFYAPEQKGLKIIVNKKFVHNRLKKMLDVEDLSKFIL